MIGWEHYNLWIKYFKDIKEVKQYIKNNPNQAVVVFSGKIKYKAGGISQR